MGYEETLNGEAHLRLAPGKRHEHICRRLHDLVGSCVADLPITRLLPPRTVVDLTTATVVCPDLALLTTATGKLWLAAEIVNSGDHQPDTVTKKQVYEDARVPRLWMIDPRYDNVEVYHATEHGLVLQGILAGKEALTEKLLPGFSVTVTDLFAP